LDVACAALHYWTLQAASSLSGGWTDTLVILWFACCSQTLMMMFMMPVLLIGWWWWWWWWWWWCSQSRLDEEWYEFWRRKIRAWLFWRKEGSKEGIEEGTKEQTNANQENDDDQDFRCYCWIPALYYTIFMLMFIMNDSWKCGGRRWRWWRWWRWRKLSYQPFLLFPPVSIHPWSGWGICSCLRCAGESSVRGLGAHEASWLWDHLLLGTGNLSRSCLEIQGWFI